MYKEKKILAIITARGGSKGLPGKNIRNLLGKPLIAWTIDHAINSKYIDKVIVSTDDSEIADISIKYGAEVPFIRPTKLAQDNSSSIDVVLHTIQWLEDINDHYDIIVLLEPTSPLRETNDIDCSLELLINTKDAESIVSVCKPEASHPEFLVKINKNFISQYNDKGFSHKRRQDLDDVYFYEGCLYISNIQSLKERLGFYHEKTLAYVVPRWKSFEIDEIVDIITVEAILKNIDLIKNDYEK